VKSRRELSSGDLARLTGDAATAFVCFVLSDEAQRPSTRGRRQKLPLKGRYVSYGVKVSGRRGHDRAERVYVSVTALEKAGSGNYEACCYVAARLESRPAGSRPGRSRPKPQEFADKVEGVRTTYNKFKLRHPWKEKLPKQDLVYEMWCGRFRFFQQWVVDKVLRALAEGASGQSFAEELALRLGPGGRVNYEALASLGPAGFTACLNSWQGQPEPRPALAEIGRFVREFFSWEHRQD